MRKILFLLTIAFAFCLTACQKEEQNNNNQNQEVATSDFAGTYDLEVVTDSISTNDYWQSREEYDRDAGTNSAPMHGTLTITAKEITGHYHVLGILLLGSSQTPVTYYDADAHLDADNRLVINSCSMSFPSGIEGQVEFGAVTYGNPSFSFRSEMHIDLADVDCGYIFTNNCTKRAE